MKHAHYMKFELGDTPGVDHVGGLPTSLPQPWPECACCRKPMMFLAEFFAHPQHLPIANALALHVYQCAGLEEGGDPRPFLIACAHDAAPNREGTGTHCPDLARYDVNYTLGEEPDAIPMEASPDVARYAASKLGGAAFHDDMVPVGARFLGQLRNHKLFNFAGMSLVFWQDSAGAIGWELA